eukprot:1127625-Rhodomonas_salina.1
MHQNPFSGTRVCYCVTAATICFRKLYQGKSAMTHKGRHFARSLYAVLLDCEWQHLPAECGQADVAASAWLTQ